MYLPNYSFFILLLCMYATTQGKTQPKVREFDTINEFFLYKYWVIIHITAFVLANNSWSSPKYKINF